VGESTKTGRNDPCHCGTGKKYKKCCLNKDLVEAARKQAPSLTNRGIKLSLPKSELFRGRRWRIVGKDLHVRPEQETFQNFILWLMQNTLGAEWVQQQRMLPIENQHAIIRWLDSFRSLASSSLKVQEGAYLASGPMQAALTLAYDLYLLQIIDRLPGDLVRRLKIREEFQGVRYEIAIAQCSRAQISKSPG
jgi:hypothetical protein